MSHDTETNIPTNNETIGIVSVCMNREKMLKVSLASWLLYSEISEVIIVDWTSDKNLQYLEKLDTRIKVVRVNNKKYFNIGEAYNLAFDSCSVDKVLKMDVDYMLNPYYNLFDSNINLSEDIFITGNWLDHPKDNDIGFLRFLNGFMYIHKKNFNKCRYTGWENYGWEDDNLYNRLANENLKRIKLYDMTDKLYIYHNPHGDKVRTEYYEQKDWLESLLEHKKTDEES